jgi:hypothetical protein
LKRFSLFTGTAKISPHLIKSVDVDCSHWVGQEQAREAAFTSTTTLFNKLTCSEAQEEMEYYCRG